MLSRKREYENNGTESRKEGGKKTIHMYFLNYCVSKSIETVPCLIVWAVSKGEELDKLQGIRQEMLAKNHSFSICDRCAPTHRLPGIHPFFIHIRSVLIRIFKNITSVPICSYSGIVMQAEKTP